MMMSLFAACSVGIHIKVKHHFLGRTFTAFTHLKIQLPQLAPNSKYLDARRIHEITNKCDSYSLPYQNGFIYNPLP